MGCMVCSYRPTDMLTIVLTNVLTDVLIDAQAWSFTCDYSLTD